MFPPYAGHVTELMAKPGDMVKRGQPLSFIEAADMVQAQNDFLAALAGLNKARSRVTITEIIEKRTAPLRPQGWFTARLPDRHGGPVSGARRAAYCSIRAGGRAESPFHSRQARYRDRGIQDQGKISCQTPIFKPLAGTVVQRKIGPGQYVSYTSTGIVGPVFTIDDVHRLAARVCPETRRRRFDPGSGSTSPCSPIRRRRSKPTSTTSPRVAQSEHPSYYLVRATIDNGGGRVQARGVHIDLPSTPGRATVRSAYRVKRSSRLHTTTQHLVARSFRTLEVQAADQNRHSLGDVIQVLEQLTARETMVAKASVL